MEPYITLTDFLSTLPEADAERFKKIWREVVTLSPKAYTHLNTKSQWDEYYNFLYDCRFRCTYGCENHIHRDLLGCESTGGCYNLRLRAI